MNSWNIRTSFVYFTKKKSKAYKNNIFIKKTFYKDFFFTLSILNCKCNFMEYKLNVNPVFLSIKKKKKSSEQNFKRFKFNQAFSQNSALSVINSYNE